MRTGPETAWRGLVENRGAGILIWSVLPLYLLVTLFIGWVLRRRYTSASDFLNASRTLPLWVVSAAFLAANCGALELVGLSAAAAQYGAPIFHFYWIGAIPGMVFLSCFMMPVYMRSGVRSLPEFLEKRFDWRVRLFNAWLLLMTVAALSGIALYAIGQVLRTVFEWPFTASVLLGAGVVLVYVALGGVRGTIYNQVIQLFVMIAGLAPLLWLRTTVFHITGARGPHQHVWEGLRLFSPRAEFDQFGVVLGLGFVLSFSYWCTDFVQIQRALAARSVNSGRLVPLLAGFGKLGFSLLVVAPALGASAFLGPHFPRSFDQTLPMLMVYSYSPALLVLGMTALLAGLMSALASNVSAFSAIWTEEIYRTAIRRNASDSHYLRVGRIAGAVAIALSLVSSYLAFGFRDLMEYVQLLFSLFAAPFFAVFLLGIFTRRVTSRGAIAGLLSGSVLAAAIHGLRAAGLFYYGSQMNANFHIAAYAFTTSVVAGLVFSRPSERKSEAQLELLTYRRESRHNFPDRSSMLRWVLAAVLIACCLWLNYLWR